MKTISVLIVALLFTVNLYPQEKTTERKPAETTFYTKVLSHFDCMYCNFIALDVESEAFKGKIVVENDMLFRYFEKTRGFDKRAYQEFVLELLEKRLPLTLSGVNVAQGGNYLVDDDLDEYFFRIIKTLKSFQTVANGGCEGTVRHYFSPSLSEGKSDCKEKIRAIKEQMTILPGYDLSEQNNVVAALFEFEIAVRVDDISGSLSIMKSVFK